MSQFEFTDQNPEPLEVVSLPELRVSDIDTSFGNVEILPADPHAEYPELRLYGELGDFEQSFERGNLTVRQLENPDYDSANSGIIIGEGGSISITQISSGSYISVTSGRRTIGDRFRSAFRAPNETVIQQYGDGSRYVNGVRQDVSEEPTAGEPKVRKVQPLASLLLPEGVSVDKHDVQTGSGSVEARSVSARTIRLASASGKLALQDTSAHTATLKTGSGRISVDNLYSDREVTATSASGRIEISGSRLSTLEAASVSGRVILSDLESTGWVNAESASGGVNADGVSANEFTARSTSGRLELYGLTSSTPVRLRNVSGRIEVSDSRAPAWNVATVSGNITMSGNEGTVKADTVSGRKRLS